MKNQRLQRFSLTIPVEVLLTFLRERFPEIPDVEFTFRHIDPQQRYNPDTGHLEVEGLKVEFEQVLEELPERPDPEFIEDVDTPAQARLDAAEDSARSEGL